MTKYTTNDQIRGSCPARQHPRERNLPLPQKRFQQKTSWQVLLPTRESGPGRVRFLRFRAGNLFSQLECLPLSAHHQAPDDRHQPHAREPAKITSPAQKQKKIDKFRRGDLLEVVTVRWPFIEFINHQTKTRGKNNTHGMRRASERNGTRAGPGNRPEVIT